VPVSILIEDPAPLTELGATLQLRASALFATGDSARDVAVTWSLVDPDVITLTAAGVATAKAEGTARVQARAGSFSAEATVEVRRAVASIGLSTTTLGLGVGASQPVEAFVLAGNGDELSGRTVAWSSDDPTIADVAPQGLEPGALAEGSVAVVTGRMPGVTTIRVTSEGREATIAVTVVNAPVALVTISPLRANITVGGTTTFTAMPTDDAGNPLTGRSITWSSADPSVAVVSGTGTTVTVTGKGPGTTTLLATSEGRTGLVVVGVAAATAPLAWARVQVVSGSFSANGSNLSGGAIDAVSEVTGLTNLQFDGLGIGGLGSRFTAYVAAEGSPGLQSQTQPGASCYISDMSTSVPLAGDVMCVDAVTRSSVDASFTIVVVGDGALGGAASPGQRAFFSLASGAQGTKPYIPVPDFSWNSAGGAMQIIPTANGTIHRHGETLRSPFAVFAARLGQPGADDCTIQSAAATEVNVGCYNLVGGPVQPPHFALGFERGRPGTDWGLINIDPTCVKAGPASTTVELDALDPAAASVVRSVASTTRADVEFVNDSCERVQLYWIDYDGVLQDYGTLAPGQIHVQTTFVTHPWLAVGLQTAARLAVFQPKQGLAVARIRQTSSSTGPIGYTRLGAGKYEVVFKGSSGSAPPAILLSPMTTGFASCSQRVTALAPVTIEVGCWGPGRQFQDQRFALAYLR